jgi:hypothetical protein
MHAPSPIGRFDPNGGRIPLQDHSLQSHWLVSSSLSGTTYADGSVITEYSRADRFMTTYLVTCDCGKKLPVEIGQAGGQVVCECGASVAVPPLRQLRHLPTAEPAVSEKKPAAAWDIRKGVASACLVVAVILAGLAGWSRYREPVVPEFPKDHVESFTKYIDTFSPADAWTLWVVQYRQLAARGFNELRHPHAAAIEQSIAEKRFLQKVLLAVAAVCAFIGVAAALWPSPKPLPATRTRTV